MSPASSAKANFRGLKALENLSLAVETCKNFFKNVSLKLKIVFKSNVYFCLFR